MNKLIRATISACFLAAIAASPAQDWKSWGKDNYGQAQVPVPGYFKDVATGYYFRIGLRTDGTLQVWNEGNRNLITPPGEYISVQAGGYFAIAQKPDRTLFAWGGNSYYGETNVPSGKFLDYSAGTEGAVGIRPDGSLEYWGRSAYGLPNEPLGAYKAVSLSSSHALAIRLDGTLVGWGSNSEGEINVPTGTFKAISAGYGFSLAIREDGTLAGWGRNSRGQATVPSGNYKQVDASAGGGSSTALALREDGTVVAWGEVFTSYSQALPVGTMTKLSARIWAGLALRPDGSLAFFQAGDDYKHRVGGNVRTFAAGDGYSVGIRESGELMKWGNGPTPPTGFYKSVATNRYANIGVHKDGTLTIWGANTYTPTGTYKKTAVGETLAAGILTDGRLAAWGRASFPANGSYTDVACGRYHAIALRSDGTLKHLGDYDQGQNNLPEGAFLDVACAANSSVALRQDGTLVAWPTNNAPPGTYKSVEGANQMFYAVATDGSLRAWGSDPQAFGLGSVPSGKFDLVVAGWDHCFARTQPATAPIAVTDAYTTMPNQVLTVDHPGVLVNDTAAYTAVMLTNAARGNVALDEEGGFTYTPDQGFTGHDSFTYKAVNSVGESSPTTVRIAVGVPILKSLGLNGSAVWIPQDSGAGDTLTGTLVVGGHVASDQSVTIRQSSSAAVLLPSSVPVTAGDGDRAFTFPITTQGPWHTENAPFTVQASYQGYTRTATFMRNVLPRLIAVATNVKTVFESHEATLTVTLDRPAPNGGQFVEGLPVRVFSIDTDVFKYPDTGVGDTAVPPQFAVSQSNTNTADLFVTVLPGSTTATLKIGARNLGGHIPQKRWFTAAFRNQVYNRALTVYPLTIAANTIQPTTVNTPADAFGTVTLNAVVGPVTYDKGPLFIYAFLQTDGSSVDVNPLLRIVPGKKTGSYLVTCRQVAGNEQRQITASRYASPRAAILDLTP